jgi:hypothetical protein
MQCKGYQKDCNARCASYGRRDCVNNTSMQVTFAEQTKTEKLMSEAKLDNSNAK